MADKDFLSNFGLFDLTREEIELRRRQALMKDSQEKVRAQYQGRPMSEQIAAQLGDLVAQAANARIHRGDLVTESEGNRADAVQSAQQRFEAAQQRNPKLAGLSAEVRQNVFQQLLADELATRGELSKSFEVAADLQDKRRRQRGADLELKRAGISLERAEVGLEIDELALTRAKTGQMAEIYPVGGTIDEGKNVYFKADGTATDEKGNPVDTAGWTTIRPRADKGPGSKQVRDYVTPRGQQAIREKQLAIAAKASQAQQMKEALEDSISNTGTIEIMDGGGNIVAGVAKFVDSLSAVGRALGNTYKNTTVKDSQGREIRGLANRAVANKYVQEEMDSLDVAAKKAGVWELLPESLRTEARAREKYYAALVQMTYAQALSQEGGSARSLSDNDFKNAMMALAGSTSDPESFREVMLGNIKRDLDNFALLRKQLDPEIYDQIIHPAGQAEFERRMDIFNEAFSMPFGTPGQPTIGNGGPAPKTVEYGTAGTLTFD